MITSLIFKFEFNLDFLILAENVSFNCLGCQKLLALPLDYIGKKVRCDACGLKMSVPELGGSPIVIDEITSTQTIISQDLDDVISEQEELAKLPRIETKRNMNVKDLRQSVKEKRKAKLDKMTDTLTEEEMLETREIEALSSFSVYSTPCTKSESSENNSKDDGISTDSDSFDLPEISEIPPEDELFGNLSPDEQTFLRPTKIHASKTIRGGQRPPRVMEKKKVSKKTLVVLSVLIVIVATWFISRNDSESFSSESETTILQIN